MASLAQWTWVWVNSGSWWWTGRPGVPRFMGSQRVGHDWATELYCGPLLTFMLLWLFKTFWSSQTSNTSPAFYGENGEHLLPYEKTEMIIFGLFLATVWDLSSPTRHGSCTLCILALEVQSLNDWTTREIPSDWSDLPQRCSLDFKCPFLCCSSLPIFLYLVSSWSSLSVLTLCILDFIYVNPFIFPFGFTALIIL